MTEKFLSNKLQTDPLKIADVVSYLKQKGWQPVIHPNTRLLVFQGSADDQGNPIELVLPSQNTFDDSSRLLAKALNLLAAIENKSPQEIIDLVTQTNSISTVGS